MNRTLNVGLIGGGGGKAFIVNPHHKALMMNGSRIVCAALHQDPEIAMKEAENWPYPIRGWPNYTEMIEKESKLSGNGTIDYVLIVTPNNVHFDPAMKCVNAGFPVFCEKPLTTTVEEAHKLVQAVSKSNIPFGVAHTYLGHWSTLFSQFIITSGLLGEVRRVNTYYWQGWLATALEETGQQQAAWRTDPKQAGASCCGGDIGTHAFMQLRFVTGLEVETILFAKLTTFVPGRQLDDNFTTICELSNGAEAHICASQIMIGHKNDLGIEVNCGRGTLVWRQEESEKVTIYLPGQPERVYWRGEVKPNDGFLGAVPEWLLSEPTLPSGHDEAFHDAFSRLHRFFGEDVRRYKEGKAPTYAGIRYAGVEDGLRHMEFIEAAIECDKSGLPVELPT